MLQSPCFDHRWYLKARQHQRRYFGLRYLQIVPAPLAVLKLPVLSTLSEKKPTAVLYVPLVRLKREFCPSAVLPPG